MRNRLRVRWGLLLGVSLAVVQPTAGWAACLHTVATIRNAEGCNSGSTCVIKNTYVLDNCTLDFTQGIVQSLVLGNGTSNGIFTVTGTNTVKANGITVSPRGQVNLTNATITLDANGQAMAVNKSGSQRGRVVLTTTSSLHSAAGAIIIRAGSLTVDGGRIESVPQTDASTNAAGKIDIQTTSGGVSVNTGSIFGITGGSQATGGSLATTAGGELKISAAGTVAIVPNFEVRSAQGGDIDITATGAGNDVNISGAIDASARSTGGFDGGYVGLTAADRVDVAAVSLKGRGSYDTEVDSCNYGSGGTLEITSGGATSMNGAVDATGANAGAGGTVTADAGSTVTVGGRVDANGSTCHQEYDAGGEITLTAGTGNVTVNAILDAEGPSDSAGYGITLASSEASVIVNSSLITRGNGDISNGAQVTIDAEVDIDINATVDSSGGVGAAGDVSLTANASISIDASISANGRVAGTVDGDPAVSPGAAVTMYAGNTSYVGDIFINAIVDASGSGCAGSGVDKVCGDGGYTDLDGCNITVSSAGRLLANGEAGSNAVYARQNLTLNGVVSAIKVAAGFVDGTNVISYVGSANQTGVTYSPALGSGTTVTEYDACSQPGQVNCVATCEACTTTPIGGGGAALANGTQCTDNQFCSGADSCSSGTCSQHAGNPCSGGAECNNSCNEAADNCRVTAGTACSSDGNVCTNDQCNGLGTCAHNNNTAACSDGLFCNGNDTCSGGSCSQHGGNPCTGGTECNNSCNEAVDNCRVTAGTACSSDSNVCTNDQCDGLGACAHPNNTAPCSDGLFCNGNDTCSGGSCSQHVGDPCAGGAECNNSCNEAVDKCRVTAGSACTNDGNVCTNDQCDGLGACAHPNNTASCNDGFFCNGNDTCSGGSCSQHAGDPCAGGAECNNSCNETVDNCHVASGTGCTSDSNVCTDDQCDGTGACAHANNTASCSDGLFCNGNDTCSGGSCSQHAGDPCASGGECNDTCDEPGDNCFTPAESMCTDDGNLCTDDLCDGDGTCAHPDISASCDDSDACTEDSCNPETGCAHENICAVAPLTLVRTIAPPVAGAFFGGSIATFDASRVVIGAPFDLAGGVGAGVAYLFDVDSGSLEQSYPNPAPEENGLFGFSVAVVDGSVVVGAPQNDVSGTTDAGLVYEFGTGSATPTATHQAPTLATGGLFGYGLGGLGTDLLVTHVRPSMAYRIDNGSTIATYTHPNNGNKWGNFVRAIGTHVAVGDFENGKVFLFDASSGTYETTLQQSGLMYGFNAATNGDALVIGATSSSAGTGSADFYDPDDGSLLSSVANPDPEASWWAFTVAVAGPRLLVSGSDQLFVFNVSSGEALQTIPNPDPASYVFGWAMTSIGNSVVVSAPYGNGVAYIYAPCSDGTVDPGEACDDGNLTNGDCCSDTCQTEPEPCGS